MRNEAMVRLVREKYEGLRGVMDERVRRQWAASEAASLGWGGISAVAEATQLDRNTIGKGMQELAVRKANPNERVSNRVRAEGGGRKRLTERDPELAEALDRLVEPMTRGHPETRLRWTCKSTFKLADELSGSGHQSVIGRWRTC